MKTIKFCYAWAITGNLVNSILLIKGCISLTMYIMSVIFLVLIVGIISANHKMLETLKKEQKNE